MRQLQQRRSGLRFLKTSLGRPSTPHLTSGEIDDTGSMAGFRHSQQCTATSLFYVIRMGGDRQQIYHCRSLRYL